MVLFTKVVLSFRSLTRKICTNNISCAFQDRRPKHVVVSTQNSMISCFNSMLFRSSICRQNFPKPSNFSTSAFVTRLDKKTCIFLLKNCKSMTHLKQIHAQIFRISLHQDTETLTKLAVFCTNPSNGNLLYAERILNCTQNPSLIIYNLIIKAFVTKRRFKESVFLFLRLRKDGLWPDNFTYPFILKAIGCLGQPLLAKNAHGFVVKTGLEFDVYVCNSLMGMYGRLGRISISKKLFDEMPERDVVSWNVLISGYVKCGKFEVAIEMFCAMRKEGALRPDEATVVSTLVACAAVKNLEVGNEIRSYVRDELEFTLIIGNALLDMYCKCGCLSLAEEIFQKMPSRNVMCWTSMLCGYVKCGELGKARELFDSCPVRDVVIWTAMINGYVQFNLFDDAAALFRDMQIRKIKPDKFIIVALLTGCAQIGALEQGKWIHGYIDEQRLPVTTVLGTALIEMYAKCGCIEKASEIFYTLREKDAAAWTSIICGLALNGMTSKALKLFSEMKQDGAKPDDITFVGVLTACSHGGLVEEGREIFNSMRIMYQIEPKLEHYGCLIDLLGRAGLLEEAEMLIQNIPVKNNETVVQLYGSLLSACRLYRNVEMGERVGKRLAEIVSSDSSVHTLLANIYASANRWQDVTNVRRKMKELGVKKAPGCSSIEVDGIIHEFLVGDPSHPQMREIYSVLDRMTKQFSGLEKNVADSGEVVALH